MDDRRVGDMTEQEFRAMIRQELHSVLADMLNAISVDAQPPGSHASQAHGDIPSSPTFNRLMNGAARQLAQQLGAAQGDPYDEALSANANQQPARAFSLEEIRGEHPRAYEGWSDEEEQHLIRLVREGRKAQEIAELLQRQPGAIRARREKLEDRGLL